MTVVAIGWAHLFIQKTDTLSLAHGIFKRGNRFALGSEPLLSMLL